MGDPFQLVAGQSELFPGDTLTTCSIRGLIVNLTVTKVDPDGTVFAKIGDGPENPIPDGIEFTVRRPIGQESEGQVTLPTD